MYNTLQRSRVVLSFYSSMTVCGGMRLKGSRGVITCLVWKLQIVLRGRYSCRRSRIVWSRQSFVQRSNRWSLEGVDSPCDYRQRLSGPFSPRLMCQLVVRKVAASPVEVYLAETSWCEARRYIGRMASCCPHLGRLGRHRAAAYPPRGWQIRLSAGPTRVRCHPKP